MSNTTKNSIHTDNNVCIDKEKTRNFELYLVQAFGKQLYNIGVGYLSYKRNNTDIQANKVYNIALEFETRDNLYNFIESVNICLQQVNSVVPTGIDNINFDEIEFIVGKFFYNIESYVKNYVGDIN